MEKMTRIAARAVIAFVKYVQALWNRTKCESVCDTVGCGVLPVPSCKGTFRAPFHPLFVSFDFGMLPP
jgi:hypothetical protein